MRRGWRGSRVGSPGAEAGATTVELRSQFHGGVGGQNMPLQNMPLRPEDYFELRVNVNQEMQKKVILGLLLSD